MMYLFLLAIINLLLLINGQDYFFPHSQLQSLKDLYDSTGGDYWIWYPDQERFGIPWNFTKINSNPCLDRWQGVECDCYYRSMITQGLYNPENGSLYSHPNDQDSFQAGLDTYLPQDSYYGFYYDETSPYNVDDIIGSSPSQINCSVKHLHLINYNLTGSLPSSLINLNSLVSLQLDWNSLTGPLFFPIAESFFLNLNILSVAFNSLEGSLPSYLINSTNMKYLNLKDNRFSGQISSTIALDSGLESLILSNNEFSGTLSDQWFNTCGDLQRLDLGFNSFSGSIPTYLKNCTKLRSLALSDNKLTGTFPIELLLSLTQIEVLRLSANSFHGPAYLEEISKHMTNLTVLHLEENSFSGEIPHEISLLTSLVMLELSENLFDESIPVELMLLHSLDYIGLSRNQLTGTIPDNFTQLFSLEFLYLQENLLTGTFPHSLSQLDEIIVINVSANHLSGFLMNDNLEYENLEYFAINNNAFTGYFPYGYFFLPSMEGLFMHHNKFIGPALPSNRSSVYQTLPRNTLVNLDISKNKLTGPLPLELLLAMNESLKVFIASSNCLNDFLSVSLCELKAMEIITLNGISSSCADSNILAFNIIESLPSCLFSDLPNLRGLYLSGNGYKGHLPKNISDSIQDLSLSHNLFSGSIPALYLERTWSSIDLSYNRLSGTLPTVPNQANTPGRNNMTEWKLLRNRLSGTIPKTSYLQHAEAIDILNGNLFECSSNRNELPTHDPNADTYNCGTYALNIQIYVWVGLFILTIIYLIMKSTSKSIENNRIFSFAYFKHYFADILEIYKFFDTIPNISKFLFSLMIIRKFLFYSAIVSLVILLPLYSILNQFFSTFTIKYAYVVSSAYISGFPPGWIFLIFWAAIIILGSILWNYLYYKQKVVVRTDRYDTLRSQTLHTFRSSNHYVSIEQHEIDAKLKIPSWKRRVLMYGSMITTSLLLMGLALVVNAGFVYSQSTYSAGIRYLCQIVMAIFKLLYAWIFIPFCFMLSFSFIPTKYKDYLLFCKNSLEIWVDVGLSIFANVIAPFVTAAFVDVNCFYNLLIVPSPAVTTNYYYDTCNSFNGEICATHATVKGFSDYDPPFQYSFQCSSSVMSNYLSVYVFMLLMDCFLIPVIKFIALTLKERRQAAKSSSLPVSIQSSIMLTHRSLVLESKPVVMFFSMYLSILFTFGMMFPPLAFMIIYHINNYLNTLLLDFIPKIQQLLHDLKDMDDQGNILDIKDEKYQSLRLSILLSDRKVKHILIHIVHIVNGLIIPFTIIMCAWFIFDIVGDVMRWEVAISMMVGFFGFVLGCHLIIVYVTHVTLLSSDELLQEKSISSVNSKGSSHCRILPSTTIEIKPVPLDSSAEQQPIDKQEEHFSCDSYSISDNSSDSLSVTDLLDETHNNHDMEAPPLTESQLEAYQPIPQILGSPTTNEKANTNRPQESTTIVNPVDVNVTDSNNNIIQRPRVTSTTSITLMDNNKKIILLDIALDQYQDTEEEQERIQQEMNHEGFSLVNVIIELLAAL